ncbi:hypothetical protein [Niveispirillum cyanobacteriorum]|nr:hypothetical protein [Niveispirillum cyanobacteriorum]
MTDILNSPEALAFKALIADAIYRHGKDGRCHEIEEIAEFRFRQLHINAQFSVDQSWCDLLAEAYAMRPHDGDTRTGAESWAPTELELAGIPFTTRSATILDASERVTAVGVVEARTDGEMYRLLAKQYPEAYGFGHHDGVPNVIPLRRLAE